MYIELTAVDGVLTAELKQADDFKRFHLLVDDSIDSDAGAAMAALNIGRPHGDGDVAVSVDWLRAASGRAADSEWLAQFEAMLDSVRKYGWITEDGQFVIAHIERQ
jgi:hypothetical protein